MRYFGSASAGASSSLIGSASASFVATGDDLREYYEQQPQEVVHKHVYVEPTWTCEYCGQQRKGLTCPGCGASIPEDVYE